jgi:hypothetical protein
MSSQMLINDFLTKQNVSLIWEVIMDDVLKDKSQEVISKINNIFYANLKGFFDNEKQKSRNVMELNKKYISLIINYIDGNFSQKQPPINMQQQYKNLEKELITHDDLQSDRMTQFDKKLITIKQDFSNAMALPIPEKPDFSDKMDEPLTELELEIKKVMAQRNYDIEQINRNNLEATTNSNTNTNWLKPQETSVKNEKVNPLQQKSNIKPTPQLQQEQSNKIKYIKIDNDDLNNEIIQNVVIDINNNNDNNNNNNNKKITSPKKQVSWNNNIENENNFEDDFFKKLKTVKPNESQMVSNSNSNSTNEINSIKEELKTFNVKIENLTQNVNAILELLKQSPSKLLV